MSSLCWKQSSRNTENIQWRYISTRDNLANCTSRGISAAEFVSNKLWWNGPKWLCKLPGKLPKQPILKFENSDLLEEPTCLNIHSILTDLE